MNEKLTTRYGKITSEGWYETREIIIDGYGVTEATKHKLSWFYEDHKILVIGGGILAAFLGYNYYKTKK